MVSFLTDKFCDYYLFFFGLFLRFASSWHQGLHIEDICFFEVNTKYISSSELKISESFDVFNSRDEIYLVFAEKKANFLFILYNTRAFSYSQSRR